jgi:hypothetical protein
MKDISPALTWTCARSILGRSDASRFPNKNSGESLRRYPVATERWPLVFMGADSRFSPHSPPHQYNDDYRASLRRSLVTGT